MRMPLSKQRNKHIQRALVEAAKLGPRQSHEMIPQPLKLVVRIRIGSSSEADRTIVAEISRRIET
jgi:hypothetical protein